jgi:hypothetical protein
MEDWLKTFLMFGLLFLAWQIIDAKVLNPRVKIYRTLTTPNAPTA